MNAAIIAAIMTAQRYSSSQTQNKFKHNHSDTECVASRLLLQEGKATIMKIADNETIISTTIHGCYHNDGYRWSGNINDQKIAGPTIEACLDKIIEESHAKEIQLIPHEIAGDTVNCYLLLLKVNN